MAWKTLPGLASVCPPTPSHPMLPTLCQPKKKKLQEAIRKKVYLGVLRNAIQKTRIWIKPKYSKEEKESGTYKGISHEGYSDTRKKIFVLTGWLSRVVLEWGSDKYLDFYFLYCKVYSFYFIIFLLKYSWFIMFRVYSKVTQLYIYISMDIDIDSFSDSFPIWVITVYWVEFPVLYSQ